MGNESFNQRLTLDERVKILQELGWSKITKELANSDGWISNVYDDSKGWEYSVNIRTGTVTDHQEGCSFDIVDLVYNYTLYMPESIEKSRKGAIDWIQDKLGKKGNGVELQPNQVYAKKYLDENTYVRIPVDKILRSKLSMSAKLVWAEIFERCGEDRNSSWASTSKIAKDLNISRRTVLRSIKELEEEGYLVLKRRTGSKSILYPVIPTSDK